MIPNTMPLDSSNCRRHPLMSKILPLTLVIAASSALPPTAAQAQCAPDGSTCAFDLWATQVIDDGNAWVNESLAVGPPIPVGCSAACGPSNTARNASAGDTTRLVATSFDHFDLPSGHQVSLVRVNALMRYPDGENGNVRLSVVVPGFSTYSPACAATSSNSGECKCALTGGNQVITDTFPFRSNPDLINQLSLRIRRCSASDPLNLRVDAFRIHVETERIPCPAPCFSNMRGDGSCDCACNRLECNFDEGDCTDECYLQGCCDDILNDGICNAQCNNAACGYDGTDCCDGRATFCHAASFDIFTLYETTYGTDLGYYESSQVTVETWIHLDGFLTDHGEPLRYVGANGSPWQFVVTDASSLRSNLAFAVGSGTAFAPEALTRGDGAPWYHIAGTYDGTMIRLYVNGVLVASAPQVSGIPTAGGEPRLQLSVKMKCQMDEIRVWSVARTQDEIRCHMTQPVPPALWPLMFDYWDCAPIFCDALPTCSPVVSYRSVISPNHVFNYAPPLVSGAYFRVPTPFTVHQPVAESAVCQGRSVLLLAGASPHPEFLSWQWYHKGTEIPRDSGLGGPTLVIPSAMSPDAGTYECVVSNGCVQQTATRFVDIRYYADCMSGPSGPLADPCGCDKDADLDVDLFDWALFTADLR